MSGAITASELEAGRGNNNIQEIFKNWSPFIDCISKINYSEADHAKDSDAVMSRYNLIEYSDNNCKTSKSLWKYYRHEPALTDAGAADNFPGKSALLKFKQKITNTAGADRSKNVKIMVPLKYLSSFWITLEMSLINCEINLMLTLSKNFIISNAAPN